MQDNHIETDDRKISQTDISDRAESIFEAINIISQRARQINRSQKERLDEYSDLIEEEIEEMAQKNIFNKPAETMLPKYPRPERLAVHEFLDDKLDFVYEDISDIE